MGRGRGRARARLELEARDRGVRARRVRGALQGARRALLRGDHRALQAPRDVDGLGQRLLHVLGHEHRVHLALPGRGARAGLALPGTPLDGLVPALRHLDLAARGVLGGVPRARAPVALRAPPARGPRRRVARRLDDDAMDPPGERRCGGEPDCRLRLDRERRVVGGRAEPGCDVRPLRARRRARRPRIPGPVRLRAGAGRGRAPRDLLGGRVARRGNRDRAHRARRRNRRLRARAQQRAPGAGAARRGRAHAARLRVRRPVHRRGRAAGHRRSPVPRAPRRGGSHRPPLPHVLALRDAARLPRRRRLVHRRRRDPPADARRERRRRVDTGLLLQAHGRLAPQHGRLEHLAQAVLRVAAPLLPVRLRPAERRRLARGAREARRARPRAAAGAAPSLDRRGRHPLRGVRRGGPADPRGRRRVARRRHRPALDARLGEPRVRARRERDRCREGAHGRRPAGSRVLGAVVSGRLGLGDARADPALVLLDLLHVGHARRPVAVPAGLDVREAPRRDGTRDAPLVGQLDRGQRGPRSDGRGRHALAVLRAAAEPEPPLRIRPGARDPAPTPYSLELDEVPRGLREHRELGADVGRSRARPAGRARAPRPLARRPHARVRGGGHDGVRELADGGRRPLLRGVRRGRLELVHPPLSTPVLGRRRRGVRDPLVRARAGAPGRRSPDALPHGPPVARADGARSTKRRRRCTSPAGPTCRLRTRRSWRRWPSCGGSSSSDGRRARARA